jgi:invasion protein IalB
MNLRTVAGLVAACLTLSPALAQDSTTATYGGWVVECRKDEAGQSLCEMTQTLNLAQSGEMIARIAIGRLPGESQTLIVFQMRAGVWLRDPVVLTANENDGALQVAATYTQCQNGYCFADAPLSGEMTSALANASDGAAGVLAYTGQGRQPVRLPVTLDGFGEALAATIKE